MRLVASKPEKPAVWTVMQVAPQTVFVTLPPSALSHSTFLLKLGQFCPWHLAMDWNLPSQQTQPYSRHYPIPRSPLSIKMRMRRHHVTVTPWPVVGIVTMRQAGCLNLSLPQ